MPAVVLDSNALMMPFYWLAISFAAHRALWQLVWDPYYWEKTEHSGRGARQAAEADQPALPEPALAMSGEEA